MRGRSEVIYIKFFLSCRGKSVHWMQWKKDYIRTFAHSENKASAVWLVSRISPHFEWHGFSAVCTCKTCISWERKWVSYLFYAYRASQLTGSLRCALHLCLPIGMNLTSGNMTNGMEQLTKFHHNFSSAHWGGLQVHSICYIYKYCFVLGKWLVKK